MVWPRLVAAADGGGTKTVFLIAEESGRILGAGRGGPVNALFVPEATAQESLAAAAREALTAAGFGAVRPVLVDALYVTAPGVTRESVVGCLSSLVQASEFTLSSDALSAFMGALVQRFGVVALAGTGSLAVGFTRGGQRLTLGGWGPLLGDEGSAYDIGLKALRAVVRAEEGRSQPTSLSTLIAEKWRLIRTKDLVELVYRWESPRGRVAALAELVASAAEAGDMVARGILEQAGRDLGDLAGYVLIRLGLKGEGCPVALTGGVAKAGSALHDAFASSVLKFDDTCRVVRARFAPAVGTLILALERIGVTVTSAVLDNLEAAARELSYLK